jgi:signal peptidase I
VRLPAKRTAAYAAVFVICIVVFAYFLLSYTRRVDGVSMYPTLQQGDLVIIEPVTMSQVHMGDIIVYGPPCSSGGDSVIHRVVGGDASTGFYTQGDDRYTNGGTDQTLGIADSTIKQSCLIGRVVFIIPYIEDLAALPYDLNYYIAAAIFIIIVVSELASARSGDESTRQEETSPVQAASESR